MSDNSKTKNAYNLIDKMKDNNKQQFGNKPKPRQKLLLAETESDHYEILLDVHHVVFKIALTL